MINKKKINIGDSYTSKTNQQYVVEELFTADSTRWVRTSTVKKKNKVSFYGKTYISYTTENKYFTEYEWRKLINVLT